MEIIKKAYKVWHRGMLNHNPYEGYTIDSLPVVYANSPSEAKSKAYEPNDFYLDGKEHKYTDLRVRRAKGDDVIKYGDVEISRAILDMRLREEERINARRKKIERYPDDATFYVQNGYVGNAVLWWGLDSRGYVCAIEKAQLYTKKEIIDDFLNSREEDVIWESKHVKNCLKVIVESQLLERNYSI